MYIEVSSDRQPGDRADLVSTLLAPGYTYCMEIALNMFGNQMGHINVNIKVCNKTWLYLLIFYILFGMEYYTERQKTLHHVKISKYTRKMVMLKFGFWF